MNTRVLAIAATSQLSAAAASAEAFVDEENSRIEPRTPAFLGRLRRAVHSGAVRRSRSLHRLAQICLTNPLVAKEGGCLVFDDDAPGFHDVSTVSEAERLIGALLDEQDRRT
jgi:hypothetical protein